jgi:hypothetical protein
MELTPVPARDSSIGRRVWLLVAAAVLAPVVLLVALPTVLGLQRYVASSDAVGDSVPRGSLTFAEEVRGSALRPGDIISFRPPLGPANRPLVTRRVESTTMTGIKTASDTTGTDPWVLPSSGRWSRVVLHVPYVGYPFIAGLSPAFWLMLASMPTLAVLLAVSADLLGVRRRRLERRRLTDRWAGAGRERQRAW